ncbi:MAG: hypothetical protein IJX18_03440 [Clostridia bacterium]|nr:hypothetical protein [Clostridia bacterium]
MMKKTKKLTVGAVCALALVTSSLSFVACGGENEESKIMSVGLNPQVEFVLDGKDKVVSVNALNEEGNLIISAEAFAGVEGKSAEEAAKLFVQVSKESGFLVSGSMGDGNELSIAISGETAQNLYQSVKADVEAYCSELNIETTIGQLQQVAKEDLEDLVAQCAPYLTQAEVQAMDYATLMQEIAASREETEGLFSQELKNAYYEAKAFAVQQAEVEVLKSKVDTVTQYIINGLNNVYTEAIDTVEEVRTDMLLAEDSIYQTALAAFREAKTEYLNYRNYVAGLEQTEVTTQITQMLENYQSVVDSTENALLTAYETASDALDSAKTALQTAYDMIMDKIEDASVSASNYIDEIDAAKTQALEDLDTAFETEYSAIKTRVETDWNEMRNALSAGYTPAESL